jgi:restriction endonuclease Mrr
MAHSGNRRSYELFVERAIEDYKDSVSRVSLLKIGDEAVAVLMAEGQQALTEIVVWQEVDRIIAKRLRLPSYASWRNVNGLSERRTPTVLDSSGVPIDSSSMQPELKLVVNNATSFLLESLSRHPTDVFGLSARQFELLIADLLARDGFEVEVTPATRDGGKDVIATLRTAAGSFVVFVECKRYAADRPVGVTVARELIGVVHHERATSGLLVTTSSFTKPVLELRRSIPHRLDLKAYSDLVSWLRRQRNS